MSDFLITLIIILFTGVFLISLYLGLNYINALVILTKKVFRILAKIEEKYKRDLLLGRVKGIRSKFYNFFNNLSIDLDLKKYNVGAYDLFFVILVISFILDLLFVVFVFRSWLYFIPVLFVAFMMLLGILYTRANLKHDYRIEAIIEAENIISNNIKEGVVKAVKNNIDLMPKILQPDFREFLDDVEYKNKHIKAALLELGDRIGSISEDFIQKLILFELEEQKGLSEIFRDVVEINNIRTTLRIEMKKQFESIVAEFITASMLIVIFLAGVIIVFQNVFDFYFKTSIGRFVLFIDLLLFIGEFIFITVLRAREL